MRSVLPVLCAVLAVLALTASAASAQTPGSEDPESDSPAGTIYEIPLDQGREDAAPPESSDEGGGAPARRPGTSSIRSENGFGSSSTVPGTTPTPAPAGGQGESTEPEPSGGERGDKPDKGGEPEQEGTNPESRIPRGTASAAAVPSPGSIPKTLLLIGLAAGVALALAALSLRARRR